MGEVIRPNFGGGKKEKPNDDVPKESSVESAPLKDTVLDDFEDAKYAIVNLDRIDAAKERIDEITDYIFDRLEGYVRDDASIALRREGLKKASMESLVNHMVDSTEQDWKKHPSFYGAVILEYRDRVEAVMSLMKFDEE